MLGHPVIAGVFSIIAAVSGVVNGRSEIVREAAE
jgi:hypothetical protein